MSGSAPRPEPLDLEVSFNASRETSEALEKLRPGPATLEELARFLATFRWTNEQLAAIPLASGTRFVLD